MILPLVLALAAMPADLKAVGLVTSVRKDRSVAVLVSGGRTRVVAVGEVAFGGRVLEIGATSVALDFDGNRVEVPLAAAAPAAPPLGRALPAVAPAPASAPEVGPATLSLPRAEMDRRLGVEMNRILGETALRPLADGDQIRGLVISRVAEGTLLTDAGLRAGDVLTEINGVAIDSLATLVGLYARLQSESHVQATVLRNGEPVSLSLTLR
jgi:type II secretion system protein C